MGGKKQEQDLTWERVMREVGGHIESNCKGIEQSMPRHQNGTTRKRKKKKK